MGKEEGSHRGVKRIRGWRKEIALGKDSMDDPLPKGKSQLATKLLALWAHGMLSAIAIREIADLAIRDGANHEELHLLAKGGNFGAQPGNVSKSIMNTFCKGIKVCSPHPVKVQVQDLKTLEKGWETMDVMLPHLMFEALQSYPAVWEQMWDVKHLQGFWAKTLEKGDDRIRGHPCTLVKGWQSKTFPCFIHGDGVEFQTRDTMMCWSFGNSLYDQGSLMSHLLCAAFPKSCTTDQTWDPVWEVLKWSFEALAKGKHPMTSPDGKPLEKGSPFWEKRGQSLSPQGYRLIVWHICGDHEFFSNTLKLAHWRHKDCCWACDATQSDGPRPYTNLDWDAFTFLDTTLAKGTAPSHPIFQIPGVTTRMVRHDSLHVLFTRGLYGHILGSILHYLCYYNLPGQTQSVQPSDRLSIIFQEIQKQYTLQKVACRLTNLHLKMFCKNPKSPWVHWAHLGAKGGECKHLAPCLLPVLKDLLDNSKEEHPHLVACLESMVQLNEILDSCDLFLKDAEFDAFFGLAKGFVEEYSWLHGHFEEQGRPLFHIVNKSHTFLHWSWEAYFINPRAHTCWKGEDFVGQIAKLGHSVSFGVRTTRLSQKLMAKYQILLHLLYTREPPAFDILEDDGA